jgi:hypothetical protein
MKTFCTFIETSRWILLRMRNVSKFRERKNTFYVPFIFSENRAFNGMMWRKQKLNCRVSPAKIVTQTRHKFTLYYIAYLVPSRPRSSNWSLPFRFCCLQKSISVPHSIPVKLSRARTDPTDDSCYDTGFSGAMSQINRLAATTKHSKTHKNVETTNFLLCERKTCVMSRTSKWIPHTHTFIHTYIHIYHKKKYRKFLPPTILEIPMSIAHKKKTPSTCSKNLLM